VQCGRIQAIVDGGPDRKALSGLGRSMPFTDRRIEYVFLSHPHDDHVTGLNDVLKRYQVKKVLYTGATHNAPNYLAWLRLVREKKVPLTIIDKEQTIDLGLGVRLEILYPNQSLAGQTLADLNQSSIVARLAYGRNKFLLTGDAGEEAEKKLIDSGADLKADVLKVGHHGSEYSTTLGFVEKIKPALAVIEVGRDNQFGHPNLRIIKRLERGGARIYRTDENGTIHLISDGKKITLR